MDTLQNMRAFVCVAETGSFTAASQQLNTTTAYVSRAVANLETHLRTRLLNRTTRRIALTEAASATCCAASRSSPTSRKPRPKPATPMPVPPAS